MTDPLADRRALREGAYADASKLAARQAIYRFVERPWPTDGGRVLGAVALADDDLVVDVGCGNGNDMRDLQRAGFGGTVLAFDLSVGMLETVAPLGVPVVNGDAASLPLRTGTADVASRCTCCTTVPTSRRRSSSSVASCAPAASSWCRRTRRHTCTSSAHCGRQCSARSSAATPIRGDRRPSGARWRARLSLSAATLS